jgi:hypothetical protein
MSGLINNRDYWQSLRAVRAMLEAAGSAHAVARAELVERRTDILTVAARFRAATRGALGSGGERAAATAALSPDVDALLDRLAAEAIETGPQSLADLAPETMKEIATAPTALEVRAPAHTPAIASPSAIAAAAGAA